MPTVIGMPTQSARSARLARQRIEEDGGIKIGCCRLFTCINLSLLLSNHGLLKVSEVILGTLCQTLLIQFGLKAANEIGSSFNMYLMTTTSCLFTSSLLLFCYVLSTRTFNLVRQSLFVSKIDSLILKCEISIASQFIYFLAFQEIYYNFCACFMYLGASARLGFSVSFWLLPKLEVPGLYTAYPAMTSVYVSVF